MSSCSRCAWLSLVLICLALSACTISSTPGTKTPESLSIVPTNPKVLLGLPVPFLATAQLHDGTVADVTNQTAWSSSNTAVGTIESPGVLKTVGQGTTTVTAVFGSLSANTGVTVDPPGIIAVNINPSNPDPIHVGDTLQFTASGLMSDGSPPPDITAKVAWASSNTTTATVASTGTATADQVGLTLISATYGTGQSALSGSITLTVNPLLTSVSILPRSADIAQKTNQQFTATGVYDDGSTQNITRQTATQWTCTPTGIAIINLGQARTNSTTGSCTVTATSGTLSNQAALTVSTFALSKLSVTAMPSSPVGVPIQFHATGQFGGSGPVQDLTSAPGISWTSSNNLVAANPNAGKTTPLAAGTTTITAKFGSATATSTLTVSAAQLSAITITTPLTKFAIGTTIQAKATGKFTDSTTQDLTNAVTWKSSAGAIRVSSSGLATASLPGSATLTASLNGVSATTPALQVNLVAANALAINPASASIAPGTTLPFKATATFSDNTQQDVTSLVEWNSSDPSAATIGDFGEGAGLASGIAAGTPSISAVFGFQDASTPSKLTVTGAQPASSTSLSITRNPTMALGSSQQLTATVSFNDGSSQDVTSRVTWSSSDITVLVVNSAGLAVTAGPGTATVTATFTSPLSGNRTATGSTTITVQ